MIYVIFGFLITILGFSYYNKVKIKKSETDYKPSPTQMALRIMSGIVYGFMMTWTQWGWGNDNGMLLDLLGHIISSFGIFVIVFNVSLNLFRGLKWSYIDITEPIKGIDKIFRGKFWLQMVTMMAVIMAGVGIVLA